MRIFQHLVTGAELWRSISPLCFSPYVSSAFKTSGGCATFAASENDRVLVGTNEDWLDPDANLRFVSASEGNNGYTIFGADRLWPETGMNDQGLVIDFLCTPCLETKNPQNKEILAGNPVAWFLKTCPGVEDVLGIEVGRTRQTRQG